MQPFPNFPIKKIALTNLNKILHFVNYIVETIDRYTITSLEEDIVY